jgi:hypothetical protein
MRAAHLGERVLVAAGALLLADSFAPWYRYCVGIPGYRRCAHHVAWANEWSSLAVVVGVVVAADAVARPGRPGRWRRVARIGAATVVVVCVILQSVVGDEPMPASVGLYVGAVLGVVLLGAGAAAALGYSDGSRHGGA